MTNRIPNCSACGRSAGRGRSTACPAAPAAEQAECDARGKDGVERAEGGWAGLRLRTAKISQVGRTDGRGRAGGGGVEVVLGSKLNRLNAAITYYRAVLYRPEKRQTRFQRVSLSQEV